MEEDDHEESAFEGPMHGLERDGGGLDDLGLGECLQCDADFQAIQSGVNGKEETYQDRHAEGRSPPIRGTPKEKQAGRASHQKAERQKCDSPDRPDGDADGRLEEEGIRQIVDDKKKQDTKKEGEPWPWHPSNSRTKKEKGETQESKEGDDQPGLGLQNHGVRPTGGVVKNVSLA